MVRGLFSTYVRNIMRSPGYGLRRKRKKYDTDGDEPVGPKLTRGRGFFRRRRPEIAIGLLILAGLCLVIAVFGFVLIVAGIV